MRVACSRRARNRVSTGVGLRAANPSRLRCDQRPVVDWFPNQSTGVRSGNRTTTRSSQEDNTLPVSSTDRRPPVHPRLWSALHSAQHVSPVAASVSGRFRTSSYSRNRAGTARGITQPSDTSFRQRCSGQRWLRRPARSIFVSRTARTGREGMLTDLEGIPAKVKNTPKWKFAELPRQACSRRRTEGILPDGAEVAPGLRCVLNLRGYSLHPSSGVRRRCVLVPAKTSVLGSAPYRRKSPWQ